MSEPPQAPPPPPPPSGDPASSGWNSWDAPAGAPPPQRQQSNGLAIAALVCGIIALLLSWIPFVNVLALLLGVVAVGCGIGGIRKTRTPGVGQKGLAIGGVVTGVLALLVSVMILAAIAGVVSDPEFREPLERLMEGEDPQDVLEDLEQQMEEPN